MLRGGLEVDGLKLVLDAIAGVAIAPDHGDQAAELLSRAEVALNDCREASRPVMLYVPGRDARVRRRLELGALLREAIATGEGLYLAFQPKVHVDDGTMAGVETLARWRHPALGEVSPGEFAPLAEQIGAIRDLTRWVAREAIRQLGQWRAQGLSFDVAVNVSAADILDPDLGDELLGLLRRHDVPPSALVLEITESALVDDASAAARNVELMQAMGIRFAIDDFGTGHSSLSLLQRLPFDELKIDRSFLANAHESADDRKIVASTIELAHAIGMKVVAEGVELEASMQLLRELGCDVAQGFLVSRPIAAADVPGFCVRAGIPIPSAGCHTPGSSSTAASS
jgi:EAL domain-containing protein (putative c-di-GMP-specific phosphodiesterase class I)